MSTIKDKDSSNMATNSIAKKPSRQVRRDRVTRKKERLEPKPTMVPFSKDFQKWCKTNNISVIQ
jgi:hypothetical protein